jgi:hypothetical protein
VPAASLHTHSPHTSQVSSRIANSRPIVRHRNAESHIFHTLTHTVSRRWLRCVRTDGAARMASWQELERVRKSPTTFKPLAGRLMKDPDCGSSEFVDGFLENIANWKRDEISLRQCEILLELRDGAEIHTHYRGLSVPILIRRCHERRYELTASDRRRIEQLVESGRRVVTGAQMGWFKRICKELGEIEQYM